MKTSTISIGSVAAIASIVGVLYTMNLLPVTAQTFDDYTEDADQKNAQQDLSLYYMQRREIRRELAEADVEDIPDLEEELEQLNDSIDIAKDRLKEKD